MSTSQASTPGPNSIPHLWGPTDKQRAAQADALLSSARAAARAAGVSRLADITRLDRVGLPVWQAVRPRSRALSVHQGKGARHADAQLGALLEAVESDAAERYDAPGPTQPWTALDPALRPSHLDDFAADRSRPPSPDTALRWVEAQRADERPFLVPFDSVSLDFTRAKASPFERASAGVSTGSSEDDARRSALLELIERDAVSRFKRADYVERLEAEVPVGTIAPDWFGDLFERLASLDLGVRVFAPQSPTGIPVFMAAIEDRTRTARPYAGTVGHAAHPDPDCALFQALAEALQSRLTFIAGAREDCGPWLYTEPQRGIVAALAPPPAVGIDGRAFASIEAGVAPVPAILDALARMGCTETAFVPLAAPDGFAIVRAFAPGLGSLAKGPRL